MAILTNPYEGINWGTISRYKGGFHNHCSRDTASSHPPEAVAAEIDGFGYDVWARTEKNSIETMPDGFNFKRVLGMERTSGVIEHQIVLFVDAFTTMKTADDLGAIQWWAHPWDAGRPKNTFAQARDIFEAYPSFIGLEIFSRGQPNGLGAGEAAPDTIAGDIHPHRRGEGQYTRTTYLWDRLLKEVRWRNFFVTGVGDFYNSNNGFPEKYRTPHILMLCDGLDDEALKNCFRSGQFFAVSEMDTENDLFEIDHVTVSGSEISVGVSGQHEKIYWMYDRRIVHEGPTYPLSMRETGQEYVRFEVWNKASDYWENPNWDADTSNYYSANVIASQPFVWDMEEPPAPTPPGRTARNLSGMWPVIFGRG